MQNHSQTKSRQNDSLSFEALEPRRVLTSTVYIDFGNGFDSDGLTINDTESASLNGPEVFGDGTRLGKFANDVFLTGQALIDFMDQVVSDVEEYFHPFDVTVQAVSGTSVTDFQTTLQASASADAYIFVGGTVASITDEVGAAVIDLGNTQDNLGFVFTDSFSTISEEVAAKTLAANIAKQAAYTFGARGTEQSVLRGGGNIMATPGTNSDGNLTGPARSYLYGWGFTRAELDLKFENGIAPGQENTAETLLTNLGANPSGVHYISTTGDVDSITIQHVDPSTVDITFDGKTTRNIDITDGLLIRVISGLTYMDNDIEVLGAPVQLTADANQIQVNDNIQVQRNDGLVSLTTGEFDDEFTLLDGGRNSVFDSGAGDDTIRVKSDVQMVISGEGDDRFYVDTGEATFSSFSAGPGFDTLDYSEHVKQGHGISDLTIWDVTDEGFTFGFEYSRPDLRPKQSGFEEVVGQVALENETDTRITKGYCNYVDCVVPIDSKHLTTVITGDSATITETSTGRTLNTQFMDGFWGDQVYVQSSARPLTVFGGSVHIGSTTDPATSTLPSFEHDLRVESPYAIIANQAGPALNIKVSKTPPAFFGTFNLPGGGNLQFAGVYTPQGVPFGQLVIDGSDSEADIIRIGTVYEANTFGDLFLTLNGNGGNDYFEFGSTLEDHSGDLDKVLAEKVNIVVNGGTGDDYVYINDEARVFGRDYLLTDKMLRHNVEPAFRQITDLKYSDVETVRLTVADQSHRFQVEPSKNTVFMIESQHPDIAFNNPNQLALVGDVPTDRQYIDGNETGSGTWYFGEGPDAAKLILFSGIGIQAQNQRLAVASQQGSSPLVQVFDPFTGKFQFEIVPYEDSFKNGIQVDTADLNGDSFPEIIVAPGWGRLAEVKIFDGRQGDFISSFFAFPSESSTPSENFLGGVDIVVGNLMGGPALEIAASTYWGTSDVRIFTVESPTEINLRLSYNPFPNDDVRGVRIAENNTFNHQGIRIAATTAPGNVPKVQIDRPGGSSGTGGNSGFEGYVSGYLGGFNAASGELDGRYGMDIVLAAVDTGSVADPFSGQFRVFSRDELPGSFEFRPDPFRIVQAFDRQNTRGLSLATFDSDLNGTTDLLLVSQSKTDNQSAGEIRVYSVDDDFAHIDSVFANHSLFDNGIDLG